MRKITIITEGPDDRVVMRIYEVPDHVYAEAYESAIGSSLLYAVASKITELTGSTVIKLRNPDIPGPPDIGPETEPKPPCGHCIAEGPGRKCWVHADSRPDTTYPHPL